MTIHLRFITIVAVVVLVGCFTVEMNHAIFSYYNDGPAAALQVYDWISVPPQDRPLIARERAIALLELGYYDEVITVLKPVAAEIEAHKEVGPASIRSDVGLFLGEDFERVMVPVINVCASLALQDAGSAAEWGDRALALARDVNRDPARFPSAWVLSALAFEGSGRLGAAQTTLYDLFAAGDEESTLANVVEHLSAPDPRHRSLVVVLLLGEGPHKSRGAISVGDGEDVSWPAYERRHDEGALIGELRIDDFKRVRSFLVEDLWITAHSCLAERSGRLIEAIEADSETKRDAEKVSEALAVSTSTGSSIVAAFDEPQEMLGWWSLPATVQVIRTVVGDDVEWCTLLVLDDDGAWLWNETIDLPSDWQDGPLFVVRRVS